MPRLFDMPLTTTKSRSSSSASTAAVEEADEVALESQIGASPVVGEGVGAVLALLDPAEPERDEREVEGPRQAPAEPLAHQLGRAVGAVGQRRQVDA